MFSVLLAIFVPLGLSAQAVSPDASAANRQSEDGAIADLPAQQVRVEERIIIRIPRGAARRPLPLAPLSSPPPRWRERPAGRCLPLAAIAGLRIEDGRSLLLFMRDRRWIRARLERTCSAREFYSGFYVERSNDGQLCTGRDLLRSRSGASCSLARLQLLVPAGR